MEFQFTSASGPDKYGRSLRRRTRDTNISAKRKRIRSVTQRPTTRTKAKRIRRDDSDHKVLSRTVITKAPAKKHVVPKLSTHTSAVPVRRKKQNPKPSKEVVQIQTAHRDALQRLQNQLGAVEKQNSKLAAALLKKEHCAAENLEDIRKAVFTGKRPLRACICGKYSTSFGDLSRYLLLAVLGKLDAVNLQRLRRVSREWKEAIDSTDSRRSVILSAKEFPPIIANQSSSDMGETDSRKEFLKNLYDHCLGIETENLTIELTPAEKNLEQHFTLSDDDLCEKILPICPFLTELTFKSTLLTWTRLLSLTKNIGQVRLENVTLVDDIPGFNCPEVFVNSADNVHDTLYMPPGAKQQTLEKDLEDIMNYSCKPLRKKDIGDLLRGVTKLLKRPPARNMIRVLFERKEPQVAQTELELEKLSIKKVESLRPCTQKCLSMIVKYFSSDKS